MAVETMSDPALRSKVADLTARLAALGQELLAVADLRHLVEQLQAERDHLSQRVEQLQAERDQLKAERSLLLHALADQEVTGEELERARQEPGGGPLAELFGRLENSCGSR
jgi:uncharacterized coiled-coil DUF342 family protein